LYGYISVIFIPYDSISNINFLMPYEILGWILERWDGVKWTGLVWLGIGTGGELL
jgi:hypothetical protein